MKLKKTPVFVTLLGIVILILAISDRFDSKLYLKYTLTVIGFIYTLHGLYKIYCDVKKVQQG